MGIRHSGSQCEIVTCLRKSKKRRKAEVEMSHSPGGWGTWRATVSAGVGGGHPKRRGTESQQVTV